MNTKQNRILAYTPALLAAAGLFTADLTRRAQGAVQVVASTVPANGDLNPYGVALVPVTSGRLISGHILVSNFNNSANLQGTGATIVDVSPTGVTRLFAQLTPGSLPGACPGGIGLTTALVALRSGYVIVGSLPTSDGTAATASDGCLIVLNNAGVPVETIYGELIKGPWDMTVLDQGTHADLFVSNVLNGTVAANGNIVNGGAVVRIELAISAGTPPFVEELVVIGSTFAERTDPAALVIGPTGLTLAADGTLYVADPLKNRIASISNAATRMTTAFTGVTVTQGGALSTPLGLAIGPQGNIAAANGANGFLVAATPGGTQISSTLLDNTGMPPGAGTLFGLAFAPRGLYFVDDGSNTLNLYQ